MPFLSLKKMLCYFDPIPLKYVFVLQENGWDFMRSRKKTGQKVAFIIFFFNCWELNFRIFVTTAIEMLANQSDTAKL